MLTDEQLRKRRTGITSTDIAAICGLNPYRSSYSVWADKLGKLPPAEQTKAMQWGELLEPLLLQYYSEYWLPADEFARRWQDVTEHVDDKLLLCTPDGRVFSSHLILLKGLETKTAASVEQVKRFGRAKDDVPEEYLVQCQWCMLVTSLARWDLAVLLAGYHGFEFRVYDLEANATLQEKLRRIARDWWDKYVVTNVQPPVDGSQSTRDALRAVWPSESTPSQQATIEQDELAMGLLELQTQRKDLEETERRIKHELMAAMGNAQKLEGHDWRATWKRDKRGNRIFRTWFK